MKRREFLAGSAALAVAPTLPALPKVTGVLTVNGGPIAWRHFDPVEFEMLKSAIRAELLKGQNDGNS